MLITNETVAKSIAALGELNQLELPVKLAYKLARATTLLEPLVKSLDGVRKKIAVKYSKKNEDGNPIENIENGLTYYQTAPENVKELNAEMTTLMCIENKIEDVETIKMNDFGDVKIKAVNLISLDWLICS